MFGGMDNRDRMRTMMGENVTEERTEQTDRPCFSALTSEAERCVFEGHAHSRSALRWQDQTSVPVRLAGEEGGG